MTKLKLYEVDLFGFLFNFGFGLMLNTPVNSYVHVGMVSSPNHTSCLAVNQYFMHILSLVTQQYSHVLDNIMYN